MILARCCKHVYQPCICSSNKNHLLKSMRVSGAHLKVRDPYSPPVSRQAVRGGVVCASGGLKSGLTGRFGQCSETFLSIWVCSGEDATYFHFLPRCIWKWSFHQPLRLFGFQMATDLGNKIWVARLFLEGTPVLLKGGQEDTVPRHFGGSNLKKDIDLAC